MHAYEGHKVNLPGHPNFLNQTHLTDFQKEFYALSRGGSLRTGQPCTHEIHNLQVQGPLAHGLVGISMASEMLKNLVLEARVILHLS